jgi:hypothetical protein
MARLPLAPSAGAKYVMMPALPAGQAICTRQHTGYDLREELKLFSCFVPILHAKGMNWSRTSSRGPIIVKSLFGNGLVTTT